MRKSKQPQSILMIGESGSGKTENTKHAVNYMCHLSNSCIENLISMMNPILEEFGNATTFANNNSSRFTKCTKVFNFISISSCSQIFLNSDLKMTGGAVSYHRKK